jgi:hypothetical protein
MDYYFKFEHALVKLIDGDGQLVEKFLLDL